MSTQQTQTRLQTLRMQHEVLKTELQAQKAYASKPRHNRQAQLRNTNHTHDLLIDDYLSNATMTVDSRNNYEDTTSALRTWFNDLSGKFEGVMGIVGNCGTIDKAEPFPPITPYSSTYPTPPLPSYPLLTPRSLLSHAFPLLCVEDLVQDFFTLAPWEDNDDLRYANDRFKNHEFFEGGKYRSLHFMRMHCKCEECRRFRVKVGKSNKELVRMGERTSRLEAVEPGLGGRGESVGERWS
ncbi:hypothetical protein GLAREA_11711 [Glarea lozoyensis ATCC 20868]|uniref:Uncharacterized protein n=2 Tax=Glarea lozoyensis TaxID=101852 RepID=S3CGW8_GLAL2|nr:uncharacterized protein GLAREA_11711 [Glarea lozoyensis ATCC 20868]EHL01372.1 hypothetical protein M7I_2705 [Glarea lozoyensis 74030]EPE25130.1 hypothetical protein GLAREA_11711 [Glarea lozoyensis ATCC 20868]